MAGEALENEVGGWLKASISLRQARPSLRCLRTPHPLPLGCSASFSYFKAENEDISNRMIRMFAVMMAVLVVVVEVVAAGRWVGVGIRHPCFRYVYEKEYNICEWYEFL